MSKARQRRGARGSSRVLELWCSIDYRSMRDFAYVRPPTPIGKAKAAGAMFAERETYYDAEGGRVPAKVRDMTVVRGTTKRIVISGDTIDFIWWPWNGNHLRARGLRRCMDCDGYGFICGGGGDDDEDPYYEEPCHCVAGLEFL